MFDFGVHGVGDRDPSAGGAILWTDPRGVLHVTLPGTGLVGLPKTPPEPRDPPTPRDPQPSHADPLTEHDETELLYEPTWWEQHFGDTPPPSLRDLATITDPEHHAYCDYLRNQHQEHVAIIDKRLDHAGAPF